MIRFTIKSTNLTVTPDVKEYFYKRMESLEKFVDEDDMSAICDAELERSTHHKSGEVFRGELTLHTRNGTYRAEANGENVEASIDKVKKEIIRELRREKRKRGHLLRHGGAKLKEFTQGIGSRGVQVKDFVIRLGKKKK